MHAAAAQQQHQQQGSQPFTFNLPVSIWAEVFKNFDQLHELRSLALVCRSWQQLCSSGTWPSVLHCTPQAQHASLLPMLRQLDAFPNLTSLDLSLVPALPEPWLPQCSAPFLQALDLDGNWHIGSPLPPPLAAHLTALNISGTALPLWGPEQPWAAALTTLRTLTANRLQRQPRTLPMSSNLFRQLMRSNTRLHTLSLASNPALTSRNLTPAWAPGPHPSPAPCLRSLCLAGCECFGDGHWVAPACSQLTHLDLSATGISDTQLRSIPLSPALQHLNLGGCARVTGEGLLTLLPLVASPLCRLRELLLPNMPRVDDARLGQLLGTWAANIRWQVATGRAQAPVVVSVDLAGCGKVTDAVLAAFLPTGDISAAPATNEGDQNVSANGSHSQAPFMQCPHPSVPPGQSLDPSLRLSAAAARRQRSGSYGGSAAPTPIIGAASSALQAHYSAAAGGHVAQVPDLAARLEAALRLEPMVAGDRRQGRAPGLQPAPALILHAPARGESAASAAAAAGSSKASPRTMAVANGHHDAPCRAVGGADKQQAAPCFQTENASCRADRQPPSAAPRQPDVLNTVPGSSPRSNTLHPPHGLESGIGSSLDAPPPSSVVPPPAPPHLESGIGSSLEAPPPPSVAPPPAPLQLGVLLLSGTAVTTLAPQATAGLLAQTHTLDLSHIEAFRVPTPPTAPTPPPLTVLFPRPAPALRALTLDACHLGDPTTTHLAPLCPHLTALSLIGCRGLTNAGLQCFVTGCPALALLAVGGMSLLWQEATALAGLTSLTELRLVRRTATLDRDLVPVLRANPRLQVLTLAGCSSITDAALAFVPKGLRELTLTCCEDVEGRTVASLRRLRLLRISSCPRFSPVAVASAAISCTRLAVLVLPVHLPRSCVPLQAPGGHLDGLRVLGGRTHQHGGGYL